VPLNPQSLLSGFVAVAVGVAATVGSGGNVAVGAAAAGFTYGFVVSAANQYTDTGSVNWGTAAAEGTLGLLVGLPFS